MTVARAIVESDSESKTHRLLDEVKREAQPSQCYSYDTAQSQLVTPTGGREPKPEDFGEKQKDDGASSLSVASGLVASVAVLLATSLL